ncbi:MAG: glycosyltransferase [Clostridiales bacterium]
MTNSKKKYFNDDEYYKKNGIKLIRTNYDSKLLFFLRKIIKDYRIDIIQAHNFKTAIIASLIVKPKTKIIFEIYSWREVTLLKTILRDFLLRKFVFKRVNRVFTLSINLKHYLIRNYNYPVEKIFFMPNGYLSREKEFEFRKSINKQYFTFGYVGNYADCKEINNIMAIIPSVYKRYSDIRFIMIGNGKSFNRLYNFIIKNGFQDRVIIIGLVSKKKLIEFYNEIDVILIPRPKTIETENSIPLKIFDAIGYGKPIIMSDVSGLTEVLGKEEALVYKNERIYELQEKISQIYKNYYYMNKIAQKAHEKILKWPTWKNISEKQEIIYDFVMKEL